VSSARDDGAPVFEERFRGLFALRSLARTEPSPGVLEVGVLLPMTFMNRSGSALMAALESCRDEAGALRIDPTRDLIVVYDDLDLPFGELRMRRGGGPGGHNGLRDLIDALGSKDLPRLRFGIGRPPADVQPIDYVLEPFAPNEASQLEAVIDQAADGVRLALELGVELAMNRVNQRRASAAPEETKT
jgi:PTH1 family peptidyl-tRNA hydrolase